MAAGASEAFGDAMTTLPDLEPLFECLHHANPTDDSQWHVKPGMHNAFSKAIWNLATRSAPEAGKAVDERYSDKIYIASKTKHAKRWRTIAATHPVSSSWIYEAGEGESTDLHDLWRRCLAEASGSKALVAYREPDEVFKGGWVEIGAALSNGVPVHAVGLNEFTIAHYRGITHHRTMKEAVTAALKEPSRSALASVAPSGATEPLPPIVVNAMIDAYKFAYNEEMRRFGKGWEAKGYDPSREATRKGLAAVFTALAIPQAVPAEDVARIIDDLKRSGEFAGAAALTSISARLAQVEKQRDVHREQAQSAVEKIASTNQALAASEAEAADLRRKLEEHRKALAEAREYINRYADTAAEHDLVARIDALTGAPE